MTFAQMIADRSGDGPAPSAAKALVTEMLALDADDPARGEFVEWLIEMAPALVAKEMRRHQPKRREGTMKMERRSDQFAVALRGNDIDALADFSLQYQVDGADKALGALTGADHDKVAFSFGTVSAQAQMLESVHRQIAVLLKGKSRAAGRELTTADLMSASQYRQLLLKVCPALGLNR